uniref:Putative secreted protein n=1 Tax=Ixodes ricinus TaxID=34613 RepID=A0A090XB72_IXORI
MQPVSTFVVVCSILAMHIPSPTESAEGATGKADQLFQFLEKLKENDALYTIKRTYKENLRHDTGTTIDCVKATKMDSNNTAAKLCTVVKSDGSTKQPFVATYEKMGKDTIRGEPGSHTINVQYVNENEKCFVVEMTDKTASGSKACDLLSTDLQSTSSTCNQQLENLCGSGSRIISTPTGCNDVSDPKCTTPQ